MTDPSPDIPVEWRIPPPYLTLGPRDVHVWRGILDRSSSGLQPFWEVLNPVEQQRARRFVSPLHQDRFIVAHAIVRNILSLYVNVPPATIAFETGPHGKPFLTCPLDTGLFFNLSHSHNLALLAITSIGEIGVDLEYNRPKLNYHAIADRIMSEEEKSIFHDLPPHQQSSAFFSCWTRKEAFVKAHGKGLGFPLHDFAVAFASPDRPGIVTVHGHPDDGRKWSMFALSPGEQYTAALVVQGSPTMLHYWHFPDEHVSPA